MCYQNDSITVKFNVSDQKYKLIKLTINGYDIEVNCSNFKDNSLRDFHKTYNDDTCELTLNYDRIKKILRYAYENNNIDTEDFYEMADEDISNGIEIKYAFASEY